MKIRVNSQNQLTLPRSVREKLNIKVGDRLLVDIQDHVIVLIPQPTSSTNHLQSLHSEIWENIDTEAYLINERSAW